MNLKRYNDFLLESILYTSDSFKEVLSIIKDDVVANDLLSLINKDIKTNYNVLNTTDTNSNISFVSDNQASAKLKSVDLSDLFKLKSNKTSIGRISKSILKDNKLDKTDREIELFVAKFKSAYDTLNTKEESIRLVNGEDIRKWYLEDRYCEDTILNRKGTLGKSCMRHSECQSYLDIYVQNPSVCQLLIQVDDNNKLRTRALLWKTTTNKNFLDRAYYTDSSDEILLRNWVVEKFGKENTMLYQDYGRIEVQLTAENGVYDEYPYMDSLPYYHTVLKKLFNHDPNSDVDRHGLYLLQETGGEATRQDLQYCEYTDDYYPEEECVYSKRLGSFLHKDDSVWSKYSDSYLYSQNAVKSKIIDDYLDTRDVVFVYTSEQGEYDYYPDNEEYSDKFKYDEVSGDRFIKGLLIEYDDKFYLKSKITLVYNVLEESKKIYESIYQTKVFLCSKLDESAFGIKISDDFKVMSNEDYYRKVYKDTIYNKLLDKINSLSSESTISNVYLKLKINELDKANAYLESRLDYYRYNNLYYDNFDSNEDSLLKWYRKYVEEYFDDSYDMSVRILFRNLPDIKSDIKNWILNPIHDDRFVIRINYELHELPGGISSFEFSNLIERCISSILSYCISNNSNEALNARFFYYYLNHISSFKH